MSGYDKVCVRVFVQLAQTDISIKSTLQVITDNNGATRERGGGGGGGGRRHHPDTPASFEEQVTELMKLI